MRERYYPGIFGSRDPKTGGLIPMKIAFWRDKGFSQVATEADKGPLNKERPKAAVKNKRRVAK